MAITRRAVLGAAAALPILAARRAHAEGAKLIWTAAPIADYLPTYIAFERELFRRHGLDASFVLGNGSTIPPVLVAGSAQIGGIPPTTLLQTAEAGIDLVSVAAADATPHELKVGLVIGSGSPVKKAEDLRGRRLGVRGLNGTFHVLVRVFLRRHGLDDGSVTILEIPYPHMIDTLRGGTIDAVTAPRPYLDRILSSDAGWMLEELVRGVVPDGTVNILHASTRAWAMANRPAINAFRAALDDGIAVIRNEPDAARAILAKWTKMPPEMLAGLPFLNYGWKMGPSGLAFWADESLRQGLITKKLDLSPLIV